jgi:hypothetical protein
VYIGYGFRIMEAAASRTHSWKTSDGVKRTQPHLSTDKPTVIALCKVELSEQSAYVLVQFLWI